MKRSTHDDTTTKSKMSKKSIDDDVSSSPSPKPADFEVHLSTKLVSLKGDEDVGALVVINDSFWERARCRSQVDCLFAFDTSGSMASSMVQQGDALVEVGKYIDDMTNQYRSGAVKEKPVVLNFAFGLWNSQVMFPGLEGDHSDVERLPAGYAPFKPAHEMGQATMLNIKQKYFRKECAGHRTNMLGALRESLLQLKQRRDAVFGGDPHHLQHLVLFTDGVPDSGQTEEMLCREIQDCIGDNAVIVHLYVLGFNINLELTERLSVGSTCGCIAYAQENDQLADALKSVMEVITRPSVAFNVKTKSSDGAVVHHRGVVQRGMTPMTHIKLNVSSQATPGDHVAGSVQLMTGTDVDASPIDIVAHYVENASDPKWASSALAQPSSVYVSYQKSETLEKELKTELISIVEQCAERNVPFDFDKCNQMITDRKSDLTPDGFRRLLMAVQTIKTANAQGRLGSSVSTPFSRRATVIASMTRS